MKGFLLIFGCVVLLSAASAIVATPGNSYEVAQSQALELPRYSAVFAAGAPGAIQLSINYDGISRLSVILYKGVPAEIDGYSLTFDNFTSEGTAIISVAEMRLTPTPAGEATPEAPATASVTPTPPSGEVAAPTTPAASAPAAATGQTGGEPALVTATPMAITATTLTPTPPCGLLDSCCRLGVGCSPTAMPTIGGGVGEHGSAQAPGLQPIGSLGGNTPAGYDWTTILAAAILLAIGFVVGKRIG